MAEETMPDKLIVTGLGTIDGEYRCDIVKMLLGGNPETLTNREGHRVKVMSGVRAGELMEAMNAGDNDVGVALAAIILTRAGKNFSDELLWDAPMGSGIDFDLGKREPEVEEVPPLMPPSGGDSSEPQTESPPSGGESSTPDSDLPVNGQSPTGVPDWPRSAISDRVISAI